MTLVPPVLVTVSETDNWLPTVTLPNAALEGLATSWPAAVPVPVSGMFTVGFVALEVIVTLPLTAPAACGANVTVKLVLCPPDKVSGVVIPLRLSPVPLIEACEIVTLLTPVFVRVSDSGD